MIGSTKDILGKKDLLRILVIIFLAVLFRLIYFSEYVNSEIYPISLTSDSGYYYIWGREIAAGDILGNSVFQKWPLYAYLLGFVFKFISSSISIIYAGQLLLGVLNCVLVFLIAKKFFGSGAGFIAGLLSATYGIFIFYEGLLIYSSLSIFLNSLWFLIFLHIKDRLGLARLFWLGIFLGVCTVTQANVILLGFMCVFWVIYKEKMRPGVALKNLSFFFAGVACILAVVASRNYLVERRFTLLTGNTGLNFFVGNNPQAGGLFLVPEFLTPTAKGMLDESASIVRLEAGPQVKTKEISEFWFEKTVDFIKDNPIVFTKLTLKKLLYLASPNEFIFESEWGYLRDSVGILKFLFTDLTLIMPFAFLGFFVNLKRWRSTIYLYLGIVSFSLSILLFFMQTKFRLVLVPFLIIFASSGIYFLWGKIIREKTLARKFLFIAIAISLFLLSLWWRSTVVKSVSIGYGVSSSDYYLSQAGICKRSGDYKGALEQLKLAQLSSPDNPILTYAFGDVYLNMGDYHAAEEMFLMDIKGRPLNINAYYQLGRTYNLQEDFKGAEELLKRALNMAPNDPWLHSQLGMAYKGQERDDWAILEFNKALDNLSPAYKQERAEIESEIRSLQR